MLMDAKVYCRQSSLWITIPPGAQKSQQQLQITAAIKPEHKHQQFSSFRASRDSKESNLSGCYSNTAINVSEAFNALQDSIDYYQRWLRNSLFAKATISGPLRMWTLLHNKRVQYIEEKTLSPAEDSVMCRHVKKSNWSLHHISRI